MPFGVGRNPSKQNRSHLKPHTERAVTTAEGPGIGITVTPSSRALDTRVPPGSLITGVPASEQKAAFSSHYSMPIYIHIMGTITIL